MTTFDLAFLEAAVNADGRSLNAIGRAAKLPAGTLSRILNRRIARPDLDHLRGLADTLGHSLTNLLGEAGGVTAEQAVEPDPVNRAGWAGHINASWRQSVESIIETGRRLVAAKAALGHGEFLPMIKSDLAFGARAAQMLMRIAADERIAEANHGSLLPNSWRTLHELSRIESDEDFAAALDDGRIHPGMERREAVVLRAGETHDDEARTDIEDVLSPTEMCALDDAIDGAIVEVVGQSGEDGPQGGLDYRKLTMPGRDDVTIEARKTGAGKWQGHYSAVWIAGVTPFEWPASGEALGAAASVVASAMREWSLKPDTNAPERALAREIMDWANDRGAEFGSARVDMPGETPAPDPGGDDLSAARPEAPPVTLPAPARPGDGWRDLDDPEVAGRHVSGFVGRFPYHYIAANRGTSGTWPAELGFWDPATATRQRYIRADLAEGDCDS